MGTPFIRSLFPIQITDQGISTEYLGQTIIFNFQRKPVIGNLSPILYKENQINFLKEEISFKNIELQLKQPKIQQRIQNLLKVIQNTICSDIPNDF